MAERFSYDGFISYSHAADGLLAPRLQAGLQRFAKPWWKRRALRMFRDESSLSANPHLWSSITEALDTSGWFVLLLSPEAAGSEWVGQEIEYWIANRDPSRILPVVTDGEFGWSDGDVVGDAVPDTLRGVFSEEPRWVDLRWAKDEDQLDLQDPRFADAVADLGSAIRGVPKDELASKEVREHRRTVRTAWAGGVALAALAVLAGALAIQSSNNAAEAERQAETAAANEAEAVSQARSARVRELTAEASALVDEDPELALLLGLAALQTGMGHVDPPRSLKAVMSDALVSHHAERRFERSDGGNFVSASPDGAVLYTASSGTRDVAAMRVDTGAELWNVVIDGVERFGPMSVSPDGVLLAVSVPAHTGAAPPRIHILLTKTGQVVEILEPGPCPYTQVRGGGFSPNGDLLAVFTGTSSCIDSAEENHLSLFSTETWQVVREVRNEASKAFYVSFAQGIDEALLYPIEPYLGAPPSGGAAIAELPSWTIAETFPDATAIAWSGDGSRMAIQRGRLSLIDRVTGLLVDNLDGIDSGLTGDQLLFSPDGRALTVTTRGADMVFDAATGESKAILGAEEVTWSTTFLAGTDRLATAHSGQVAMWDLARHASVNLGHAEPLWINWNKILDGPAVAVEVLTPDLPSTGDLAAVLAVQEGDGWASTAVHRAVQLLDGTFLIVDIRETAEGMVVGPIVHRDLVTGEQRVVSSCEWVEDGPIPEPTPGRCGEAGFMFGWSDEIFGGIAASPNGTLIAAHAFTASEMRTVRVWETDSLEELSEFEIPASEHLTVLGNEWVGTTDIASDVFTVYDLASGSVMAKPGAAIQGLLGAVYEITADGSLFFTIDDTGRVWAFDTDDWSAIDSWSAGDSLVIGLGLSPDGSMLATAEVGQGVKVWDVARLRRGEAPALVEVIRTPGRASDAKWVSDDVLAIALSDGARWMEHPLTLEGLERQARFALTRSLTAEECVTYRIDPCPSLEELRGG